MPKRSPSRRDDYAAETRAAILDAARLLFAQKGYFATTVEEIAREARVAPATVYAVGGGKRGLIHTLVDLWSQAPIVAETLERQAELDDRDGLLENAAAAVRSMREDYGDIMRLVIAAAPHDASVRDDLRVATARYRGAIATLAARLHEVGGLHPDMTVQQATDILWFYFGFAGLFTLVEDNGWSYDQAQRWLVDQAGTALRSAPPLGVRR